MNVSEIINLTREYLDEPSADATNGDYPDSALIQFINAENRHLVSITRQFYEDWNAKEYVFPLTTSTLNYTLPREVVNPRRVEVISSGVSQVTDNSVSPSFNYYVVDDANAVYEEVIPNELSDNSSDSYINYVRNNIKVNSGYILWDNEIRFASGTIFSTGDYCRIYYLPSATDIHQATCSGAGSDYITLGTNSVTTTIGTIKKINDYYSKSYVEIVSGNGIGEIKRIARHDPVTNTVWIEGSFTTTPDTSSVYSIVSPIIEDYQELLALGATMRAKGIKTEDDVTFVGAMYQGVIKEMKSDLSQRIQQRTRMVRQTRGY